MVSANEMQIETEREKERENLLVARAVGARFSSEQRCASVSTGFRKFQSKHANEIITRSLCT